MPEARITKGKAEKPKSSLIGKRRHDMEVIKIKQFIFYGKDDLRSSFEKAFGHKILGYFDIAVMWRMPQLNEEENFIRITECTTDDYNKDFCKQHTYSWSQMYEHLKKYYKLSIPKNMKEFNFAATDDLTLEVYY